MEGTSTSPGHRQLRSAWFALGLLALLVAVCSLRRVYDPDLWWHMRTGDWIWEHRAIPKTDPFSHTAPGPLRYTEVLAQLWVFGLHALGGVSAVVLGMALVTAGFVVVTGWLVLEVAGVSAAALAWTMALVSVAVGFRLGPKMDVFSFLASSVLLRLLFRVERNGRTRSLIGIPPLMLAWVNLHRGGTLGLALLVLVGIVWLLERRSPALRKAFAVTLGAACLATLCNTSGLWYLRSALGMFTARAYVGHPELHDFSKHLNAQGLRWS